MGGLTVSQCGHIALTLAFQIIGRGNDQVAISSKFETREDIGESPVGLVGVGLRWLQTCCRNKTPASVASTGGLPTLSAQWRDPASLQAQH